MNRKDHLIVPRLLLQHVPMWEWSDDSGGRGEYEEDNRILLEVTFLENKTDIVEFEDHGLSVRANLTKMEQEDSLDGVPGGVRRICRIDKKEPVEREGQSKESANKPLDKDGQLVPFTGDGKKEGKKRRRRRRKDGKDHGRKKKRKKGRSKSSYSSYSDSDSYSSSSGARRHGRRKKRKRRVRKSADRRGKEGNSQKRPMENYAWAPRPMQKLGNTGCGNHQEDIEKFIHENGLDDRTVDAMMSLSEPDQKSVMGTDGGENTFGLTGKVKNPDAVVMSRIRKLRT